MPIAKTSAASASSAARWRMERAVRTASAPACGSGICSGDNLEDDLNFALDVEREALEDITGDLQVMHANPLVKIGNGGAEAEQSTLPLVVGLRIQAAVLAYIPAPRTGQRPPRRVQVSLDILALGDPGEREAALLQQMVSGAGIGIGKRVIVPLDRLALAGQVVEGALIHRLLDVIFDDIVPAFGVKRHSRFLGRGGGNWRLIKAIYSTTGIQSRSRGTSSLKSGSKAS